MVKMAPLVYKFQDQKSRPEGLNPSIGYIPNGFLPQVVGLHELTLTWPLKRSRNRSLLDFVSELDGHKCVECKEVAWEITPPWGKCFPRRLLQVTLPVPVKEASRPQISQAWGDGCQRFPLSNFKYWFNSLFKVLFIFPSRYIVRYRSPIAYLALDEIYHPIRTAFPSYPTRRTGVVSGELRVAQDSHPPWHLFSKDLHPGHTLTTPSTPHNSVIVARHTDSGLSSSRFTRRY